MPTLLETQSCFRDALFDNEPAAIRCLINHSGMSPQIGLGIYRNNVFTNLREALRTIYPVVNKLVGDDFFNYAADRFIQQYPSPAGDLNQFGEAFATFLSGFEPASDLVYLHDMAQLEWLAHRCYHASEVAALDLPGLARIPASAYAGLRFILNPACALMRSRYPVHRIWQVNQPGYTGDNKVTLEIGDVHLLLQRCNGLIAVQILPPGDWAFLDAITCAADFACACNQALHTDTNFNLESCMHRCVNDAVLVDIEYHGKLISES